MTRIFTNNNFLIKDTNARGNVTVTNEKLFVQGDSKVLNVLEPEFTLKKLEGSRNTKFRQDLSIVSGDSVQILVTVVDSLGNAALVSNSDLTYKVSSREDDGNITTEFEKTVSGGIDVSSTTDDSLIITIQGADTDDLSGLFAHELEERRGSNEINTLFKGRLRIRSDLIV